MDVDAWVAVLWGKSAVRAGGRVNLLVSHMFDSAAVAELVWDRFLAPSVRDAVSELAGGVERGRRLGGGGGSRGWLGVGSLCGTGGSVAARSSG
ncbi:HD domain-containing protein [Nocardia wallacei]|uniref:HD domain-containing protein n=1 Tax=Nocardia wallacei TaxID=480035 RepID=UPI003CC7ECAD